MTTESKGNSIAAIRTGQSRNSIENSLVAYNISKKLQQLQCSFRLALWVKKNQQLNNQYLCNAMCSETHNMASNCNRFGLKLSKSEFTLSQLELGGRWELGWYSMICTLVSSKINFSCNLRI